LTDKIGCDIVFIELKINNKIYMEKLCSRCGNIFHTKKDKILCGNCRQKARKVFGKEKLFCNRCFSSELEPSVVMPNGGVATVKCLSCKAKIRMNNILNESQLKRVRGGGYE